MEKHDAEFVVTRDHEEWIARVCGAHLPDTVKLTVPQFTERVNVAPLNDTAGFPCDWENLSAFYHASLP